jgi:nucleotide-binding universal stress UspA family protein
MLVALDGSPTADGVLALALEMSRQYGCELILCTAVDREAAVAALSAPDGPFLAVDTIFDTIDAGAASLLKHASARASAAGVQAITKVLDGRTAVALADFAHDAGVDAIVMGTHGRRGLERLFLGSTAEGVLRLTAVPTFVVHEPDAAVPAAPARGFGRILVALDESDPADAAFLFALDLAADKRSSLLCCTVIETSELLDRAVVYGYDPAPYLATMHAAAAVLLEPKAALAQERGLTVESVIVEGGKTGDAINAAAASHAADLIVVGTHGRRGLQRFFLGSVTEGVVRGSALPVAVVRASASRASAANA